MSIADRIKNILVSPKEEWPKIDAEAASVQSLFTGYVMVLSAIGPVILVITTGGRGILAAVVQYVAGLAVTYLLALIVDALAPNFGGQKDFVKSLKLVAYSWTAAWIVGGLGGALGVVGALLGFAAMLYSLYTFFLGAPVLNRCAQDRAVVFTIIIALCGFGLGLVVGMLMMPMMFGARLPSM